MTDNQWFQLKIGEAMKSENPKKALCDLGMDLVCKVLICSYMIHYADNDEEKNMCIEAENIVHSQLNTVSKLLTDITKEEEDEPDIL